MKKDKKIILTESLGEIKKKLYSLQIEKKELEDKLNVTESELQLTKEEEANFKQKLFELIDKETSLRDREEKLKIELQDLNKKLSKVKDIGKKIGV